ncbi:MAG: hypothetical protein EAZ30_00015 [Betaproteobacteria bacterium]|nr:MAG: hypothetical protein EAZ30_00015 [Betaproteobacteria bacterium]
MPAAKQNLLIEQGTTWRYALELKAGVKATDPALNLTGYTAQMQLRSDIDSAIPIIALTIANGRITTAPLLGRLELLLSATETAALSFDRAVYDLEITSAGGEVTRVLQGSVALSKEVTR